MKKCMGCMSDYEEKLTVCPVCGYSEAAAREQEKKAPDALPAETILQGRFIVGRILELNYFSIVYVAWDALLSRRVVIRELYPYDYCLRDGLSIKARSASDQNVFSKLIEQFEEEISSLSMCQDIPFILNYYRTFRENGTSYSYTEYLEGNTLEDLFPKGKKTAPGVAMKYMRTLYTYIDTLHERNVIHGNITLSSIYICADGSVKMIDFGMAKRFLCMKLKSMRDILDPCCCAPEIMNENITAAIDIYALGAIYYRLLTGCDFQGKSFIKKSVNDKFAGALISEMVSAKPVERLKSRRVMSDRGL